MSIATYLVFAVIAALIAWNILLHVRMNRLARLCVTLFKQYGMMPDNTETNTVK